MSGDIKDSTFDNAAIVDSILKEELESQSVSDSDSMHSLPDAVPDTSSAPESDSVPCPGTARTDATECEIPVQTEQKVTESPTEEEKRCEEESRDSPAHDSTCSNQDDEPELDEIYLAELERDLTEDEKQARQKCSQEEKSTGNLAFKEARYGDALTCYSKALHFCPLCHKSQRAILYSNRAACKMKLERYEVAVKDCTKAIELNDEYLKAYLRRAKCYEELEKLEEALQDYQKVLELDAGIHEARAACLRLPEQIKDRNEKLKTEMLGKLKDLGNMVLRPFGLSTNNFQVQQDPNSGSYSINFQQNPPPKTDNGK